VFGEAVGPWPEGFRELREPRLWAALNEVRATISELPLERLHFDGDENSCVQPNVQKVIMALQLPFCQPNLFWKQP
jgi:hypothetical protein